MSTKLKTVKTKTIKTKTVKSEVSSDLKKQELDSGSTIYQLQKQNMPKRGEIVIGYNISEISIAVSHVGINVNDIIDVVDQDVEKLYLHTTMRLGYVLQIHNKLYNPLEFPIEKDEQIHVTGSMVVAVLRGDLPGKFIWFESGKSTIDGLTHNIKFMIDNIKSTIVSASKQSFNVRNLLRLSEDEILSYTKSDLAIAMGGTLFYVNRLRHESNKDGNITVFITHISKMAIQYLSCDEQFALPNNMVTNNPVIKDGLIMPPNTYIGIGGPKYITFTSDIKNINISRYEKIDSVKLKQYLTNNFT